MNLPNFQTAHFFDPRVKNYCPGKWATFKFSSSFGIVPRKNVEIFGKKIEFFCAETLSRVSFLVFVFLWFSMTQEYSDIFKKTCMIGVLKPSGLTFSSTPPRSFPFRRAFLQIFSGLPVKYFFYAGDFYL